MECNISGELISFKREAVWNSDVLQQLATCGNAGGSTKGPAFSAPSAVPVEHIRAWNEGAVAPTSELEDLIGVVKVRSSDHTTRAVNAVPVSRVSGTVTVAHDSLC